MASRGMSARASDLEGLAPGPIDVRILRGHRRDLEVEQAVEPPAHPDHGIDTEREQRQPVLADPVGDHVPQCQPLPLVEHVQPRQDQPPAELPAPPRRRADRPLQLPPLRNIGKARPNSPLRSSQGFARIFIIDLAIDSFVQERRPSPEDLPEDQEDQQDQKGKAAVDGHDPAEGLAA